MATSIRPFLLVLVAVALLTTHASATLVRVTDPMSPGGADNVTFDSATGLYWLDWTASLNVAFDDMPTLFGAGETFEGWRHATQSEAATFAAAAGLPITNHPNNSVQFDGGFAYETFADFVGVTLDTASFRGSYAYTGDDVGENTVLAFVAGHDLESGRSNTIVFTFGNTFDSSSNIGHVLVRTSLSAVPEPSIALIGAIVSSGLMATVGRRRRG